MTVRKRALIIGLLLVLTLFAVFLMVGNYFNKKYLEYSAKRFDLWLVHSMELSVNNIEKKYYDIASELLLRDGLLMALKTHNREKLFQIVMPEYKELRAMEPFFHVMTFTDKDGNVILRMHRPDSYDDNIFQSKKLVKAASFNHARVAGFETSTEGVFYSIVVPVLDNRSYIGSLEIGIDANFLIDVAAKYFNFRSAIFISNPNSAILNTRNHIFTKNGYFIDGTKNSIFKNVNFEPTPTKKTILKESGGSLYSFHNAYEFRGYEGDAFGYLVVAQNIDEEMSGYKNARKYLVFVILGFLIVGIIALYYSFRAMLKAIEDGKKSIVTLNITDSLTGLLNRTALVGSLEQFSDSYIILINIDSFKEINDVFGIEAGDHVLKEYALYIKHCLSKFEEVEGKLFRCDLYRLGRDEFVILLVGESYIAEKLADYISEGTETLAIEYQGIEISFSVSIGIAENNGKPLQSADMALKVSRERKKSYMCFDETMKFDQQKTNNFFWLNTVKQAIREDRVIPYFQGIIDNKSGNIVKYECLVRIIETDGSIVSPGMFLPIIKKTKLYPQITKIMLEKCVKHFENKNYSFSLNISTEDIMNKDTVTYIQELLGGKRVAEYAVFEILETDNIGNYAEMSEFISEIKKLGCKVAIDDFGTGYSNFTHLMNLDLDYLKIDGSLIQNAVKDEYTNRLVRSIVGFAKGMNILTVAEFVSSEDIFEEVKAMGIDYSQGFFIAKPMPDTLN